MGIQEGIKAGWKTSEFWLSVVAIVLGVLITSDVLPTTHWVVRIAGLACTALGSIGYSLSRGISKIPPARLGVLLPFLLSLAVMAPGCSSWQKTAAAGLQGVEEAAKQLSATIEPVMHERCLSEAKICAAKNDQVCQPLTDCQDQRRSVNHKIIAVHTMAFTGLGLVALGQEAESNALIKRLSMLYMDVSELLKKAGLL